MADNDKAQAAEYREKLTEMLAPACAFIQQAQEAGWDLNFNIGPSPAGQIVVTKITVAKRL